MADRRPSLFTESNLLRTRTARREGLAAWLRDKANTAFATGHYEEANRFSGWASEVEAVQAQPASSALIEAAQKAVRVALDNVEVHPCDRNNDEVRAKFLWSEIAELRNALSAAQPASAPMGEPLSDRQIDELWLFRSNLHDGEILPQVRDLARAIEAAHGIQGESSRAALGVKGNGNG